MKIKLFILMLSTGIFFNMAASEDSDSDITLQASDTLTEIIEFDQKEVSVSSSMTYELMQMFTHESHHYKKIEFGSLYDHYKLLVLGIVNSAMNQSKLSRYEILNSSNYTVIGDRPLWNDEPLFDRTIARDAVIKKVKNYIDNNEADTYRKCVGLVLQSNTSKTVIAPLCCDLQIHKNCFEQCKNKNVTKCLNPFCEKKDWNEAFYSTVLSRNSKVPVGSLYDADCPLCLQPLKVHDNGERKRKINNKKDPLVIENDGTTFGGKHTRFL